MKKRYQRPATALILAAATGFSVLTAVAPGLASDDYTVIGDFDTFKARFIGPKIMDPQDSANYFVINEDGTIGGNWHGHDMVGEWRWEDGYFCRSLSAPRPAPEDCQEWSHTTGKARLVRNRGAGDATEYALEE